VRNFARAGAPLAAAAIVAAAIVGVRLAREDSGKPARARPVSTVAADVALAEWQRLVEERIEEAAAGSTCHSSVRGDFDGDRRRDTALVYGRPADCLVPGGAGWVALILGNGRRIERSLRAEGLLHGAPRACMAGCAAFASADVDEDGRDELALELDHGASQTFFGLFRLAGNRLVRIPLLEDGKRLPITFGYNGSLCCASDTLCRSREGRGYVVDVGTGHDDFWTMSNEREYLYDDGALRRSAERAHYWPWRGTSHLVPGRRCFDYGPQRDGWPQFRRIYLDPHYR
jgi:hypothetical protein